MTAFQFYTQEKTLQEENLKKANSKLFLSSMLRLAVFLLTVVGIYFYFSEWKLAVTIAVLGFGIFLFLVSRHSDLKYNRDKIQELLNINETELKVLKRNFYDLPDGSEYEDHSHPFSQDIDLFGKKSFFQYLNRTALKDGRDKLAAILTENSITDIPNKQKAIQELEKKVKWRQEFSAVASLVKTKISSEEVLKLIQQHQAFVPRSIKWGSWIFTAISLVLIAAYFTDFLNGWILFGWYLLGWGITGRYIKKINLLSEDIDHVQETFQQYYKLLELIEKTEFSSEILKAERAKILYKDQMASATLKEFSKIIDAFDQRSNQIFIAIGNGFMLWDLRQSLRLENWMKNHSQNVQAWFEVIEFIDAYNSLGNFSFNHEAYVFPEIISESPIIKASNAVHPLLNPEKAVTNDFQINNEQFFIITGANMAGKSTFLRTVSLQIVMANVGLPVCATSCEYTPIKLITSMRTTDSLSEDESYFFSELKRLQFIVQKIKTDKYFIILDEILKGTNSTDKAIGSKKFIQKLVKSHSTGIIATHDLSLCEVAKELPQVENHYFDAEIINNELNFDYRFKDGICRNMNASFLLKKMEIVD
ncbi:MAG: DNA mismatch repair protein MutS [Gillisia sp.]